MILGICDKKKLNKKSIIAFCASFVGSLTPIMIAALVFRVPNWKIRFRLSENWVFRPPGPTWPRHKAIKPHNYAYVAYKFRDEVSWAPGRNAIFMKPSAIVVNVNWFHNEGSGQFAINIVAEAVGQFPQQSLSPAALAQISTPDHNTKSITKNTLISCAMLLSHLKLNLTFNRQRLPPIGRVSYFETTYERISGSVAIVRTQWNHNPAQRASGYESYRNDWVHHGTHAISR